MSLTPGIPSPALGNPGTQPAPGPAMRAIDALPGWICTIGGCFLVALLVLIPSWLQVRSVGWQRNLMALQAARLTEQLDRYDRFHTALTKDDPILLERLAFTELRQKPVGADVFDPGPGILLTNQTEIIPDAGQDVPLGPRYAAPGSIQAWLHVPMPVVGRDIKPLPRIQSEMIRIASGTASGGSGVLGLGTGSLNRLLALFVAFGILTMGLLLNGPKYDEPRN